jgi:hypothetical protein
MVGKDAQTRDGEGKAMVMRIRRAALMVALTLLMATSLAGVAWAANVIRCAPRIVVPFCEGTGKNDVMYGRTKPTG